MPVPSRGRGSERIMRRLADDRTQPESSLKGKYSSRGSKEGEEEVLLLRMQEEYMLACALMAGECVN